MLFNRERYEELLNFGPRITPQDFERLKNFTPKLTPIAASIRAIPSKR